MCVWCGFPYDSVVDYTNGYTVCTNCGSIIDREFSFTPDYIIQQLPDPNTDMFEESFVLSEIKDIHIFINLYCSSTLCMSRREIAKVRKAYNHIKTNHPHRVFLHSQEHVMYAIINLIFGDDMIRLNTTTRKIANKLKEHECLP